MKLPRFSLSTLFLILTVGTVICWAYWIGWPRWQLYTDKQSFIDSVKKLKSGDTVAHREYGIIPRSDRCKWDLSRWRKRNGNFGTTFSFDWRDESFCVYIESTAETDPEQLIKIELYQLMHPLPGSKLGSLTKYQELGALGEYLSGEEQINPGFDLSLLYADPPSSVE